MVTTIYGDSLKEALKNFVKINEAYDINKLLVADANKRYNVNLNYYKEFNKNKVNIKINPINNDNDNVGWNTYPSNTIKPIMSDKGPVGYMLPQELLSPTLTNNLLSPISPTLTNNLLSSTLTNNLLSPTLTNNLLPISPMITAPNRLPAVNSYNQTLNLALLSQLNNNNLPKLI
jgi:hypothetical protein